MFRVSATTNAADLERRLNNAFARQVPFATALALTRTAQKIREAEKAEMQSVFDRPTPFTLNAFQVVPANKDTLAAEVRYKDTPPWTRKHFLEVQVEGGPRPSKGFERRLQFAVPEVAGFAAVIPARTAQKDAFGNWSAGERNRVLSALQAQGDWTANTTDRSRARNRRRAEYLVGKVGRNTGVFRRYPGADDLDMILIFVRSAPTYTPRFDFYGTASRTFAAIYNAELDIAIQKALDTAR